MLAYPILNMKRIIIPVAIATIFAFTVLLKSNQSRERTYLLNISKHNRYKLDGPEKSAFRDVLMTMNPITGEIPVGNLRSVVRNQKARALEVRNFGWEQVQTEIAGRTRAIMVDPNDGDKLWSGGVTGGLWFTPDFRNNASWIPVSDDWENMSIACITYDPNNTNTFYVGTGESFTSVNIYRESTSVGAGIYKSTNGGNTWILLPSTSGFDYVNDIVVRDEDGTSVIYAGVASGQYQGNVFGSNPSDGLYRSDDGGETWTQVLPTIPDSSVPYAVADIELTEGNELYVGTMRNLELKGGGVILNSSDGLNWSVEDRFATSIVEEASLYGFAAIPGRVKITSEDDMIYAVATAGELNSFNQIRDIGFFTRLMYYTEGAWADLDGPTSNWASIPWHALAIDVDPNNPERLSIGGLDTYTLSNALSGGSLSWAHISDWSSMYYFSDYLIPYYGLTNLDSIKNHFVHADIHHLEFVSGSSDEFLASTDGGIQYSADFSKSFGTLSDDRLSSYPIFYPINNSLATTQYYTVALHPDKGNMQILAGSQDNSTHTSENGNISYSDMIGGGDGAFCFFDRDDPGLRITSSQSNAYNIWIGSTGKFYGLNSGTFINPAAYDDRSNLLYVNMAVDGGFEALNVSLEGRYLDTLGIINVNDALGRDMLGLQVYNTIKLGTNSTVAFSALKVSPYDDELNATIILGNQLGDVYKVEGLPYSPVATKIDDDQLPVGYISGVDIGRTNDEILISFSNYGVTSIWYTNDGGESWQNIERDLPDIPVRDAKFNPYDRDKVIIATEMGIWGLESIIESEQGWKSYNQGLPNVRVDMLQVRKSDSTVALATHGRGAFIGKFDQGSVVSPVAEFDFLDKTYKSYENIDFDASNSLAPEGAKLSYSWDFGDGSSGNGKKISHSYDESGAYMVTLTVANGGKEDSNQKFVMVDPLGIEAKKRNIYPNPTSGILNFSIPAEKVQIHTLNGKMIKSVTIEGGTVDITSLSKGIYFINIINSNKTNQLFKVIKK